MSALCPNLLELKNGKNISQIVFLIGEAISPRSTRLQKIIGLGNFYLKSVLHRIIITKKELKKFNIASDDHCNLCSRTDSIMHTFLECDVSISLFSSTIKWFNDILKLNVNPSVEQILFSSTDEIAPLTSIQKRRLDLLLMSMKHYLYLCKVFSKNPNMSELQTKLQMQWKIEHCSLT